MKIILTIVALVTAAMCLGQDVATQPIDQTVLSSDTFVAVKGTDLASRVGWSRLDGAGSLVADGSGAIVGKGEKQGVALLASPAPGSGAYTVSVTLSQHVPSDSGGPIAAQGPSGYLTAYPRNGSMVVVESTPGAWKEVATVPGWSQIGDDTVSIDVDPDAGTARFRVNDGKFVSFTYKTSLASQRGSGLYNYHFSDAYSAPARYSNFQVTGTPAAAGIPGVLHTLVRVVDVRASSPAEAISTVRDTPAGSDAPPLRLDQEAYEAVASLPSGVAYPTASTDATTTVDLPRQLGYMPETDPYQELPAPTIGPRSASATYRVYVLDREGAPMPLADAKVWVTSLYAVPVALGRALSVNDYLFGPVPWNDWIADHSQARSFSMDGKTVAVPPMRWAAFDSLKVSLPTTYQTTKPTFAIPIDPAILGTSP